MSAEHYPTVAVTFVEDSDRISVRQYQGFHPMVEVAVGGSRVHVHSRAEAERLADAWLRAAELLPEMAHALDLVGGVA